MATATALGYHSMAPRSQLFGATYIGDGAGSRQIALTFDDGPNDPHTLRLLEVLDRHQAKATFFMVGRYVNALPRVARAVAEAGHAIGNHTYTHPNLIFSSPTQIRLQLQECRRALTNAVGEHTTLFRPPHGGRRPDVLRVVRQMGFLPVMWSVSSYDWSAQSPEDIEAKVCPRLRGGDIVLLHDGGHLGIGANRSATVTATERLICRYLQEGWSFVTVPQMMAARPTA